MATEKKSTIDVKGSSITILSRGREDYISLSDMVRNFEDGSALIEHWRRNKDTVEFLGIWEQINNPDFNSLEFEGIKNEAGKSIFLIHHKRH